MKFYPHLSAAEPINISDVDFVSDSETELMDYLLDEFERTFGENWEGILISELREDLCSRADAFFC